VQFSRSKSILRLLFITSHPIQYNAPLFSYLAKNSSYTIKVVYTLGDNLNSVVDNGFGIRENWNIDLLCGYDYEFIENTSYHPSSITYLGIKNPSLIKNIKAYKPDAIIIYGWKHQSHFSVMNYFHGKIPILFRGDSTTLDDSLGFSLRSHFRYIFLKRVYAKVDYVLSPGTASDQYFLKSGLKQNQIIRAEHAIDNERFMYMSETDNKELLNLKSSLSINESQVVFLFAGKFIDKKNPLHLIEAFEQLKKIKNNVRLLLVGNGILEEQIKERISRLPFQNSSAITVLPFQDQRQMKLLYRVANVFVLPSKSETWGLSINEALACGTPVIVSDKCGASKDLVKHEENGLVFKSDDYQDLIQKMERMCNDEFRKRLAAKATDSLVKYTYQSFKTALDQLLLKGEN
jgi:glycosyltransferase involved in cell wall biosynthesis